MKVTPRIFFLYLTAMATLYVSAVSLLVLWFQYIDVLFPDALDQYYDPYSSAIRYAIASLIIIFPLYLFFTRLINQSIRREPESRDLWIRKWLIYITLFVAGITLVVDLVVLVNTFLGGEITTRFVLKALAVLIVIGAGFVYYLLDLKGTWEVKKRMSEIIGVVTILAVVGSIVAGFFIVGSPMTQRDLRLDQQRVSHLQSIQWSVVNYWQQKQRLPENLSELADPLRGFIVPMDPVTKQAYEYRVLGARKFELCATFARAGSDLNSYPRSVPEPMMAKGGGIGESSWNHEAGRTCFERTIDPDFYPPYSKS